MSLRTDGNVEAYIDRKLSKYLKQLVRGGYTIDAVTTEFKALILAAMADDPAFYRILGEGDVVTRDDVAGS